MLKQFKIIRKPDYLSGDAPDVGEVVTECPLCDYGLKSDDERAFGYECINITRNSEGGYPFFVFLKHFLESVESSDEDKQKTASE